MFVRYEAYNTGRYLGVVSYDRISSSLSITRNLSIGV